MPPYLQVDWLVQAEAGFLAAQAQAIALGHLPYLMQVHDTVMDTIGDLPQALSVGEELYALSHPGAAVRQWSHELLLVTFAVFTIELLCFVISYTADPNGWPP